MKSFCWLAWIAGGAGVAALGLSAAIYSTSADLAAAPGSPSQPPARLEDTGLYLKGQPGVIAPKNRAFSPQYPLWSDGARKARWVYLPPGATIDARNPGEWDFPVGTKFWKEFTFNGHKAETRFLWRATPARWVFASYRWNADGTEATLAAKEGVPGVADLENGRTHTIPSTGDCRACHEASRVEPLGFNALQLSVDRDPNAIHGEALAEDMLTMKTLVDEGRLRTMPGAKPDVALRIQAAHPDTRAIVGYLTTNCGVCHQDGSVAPSLGASLKHRNVLDADAIIAALANQQTSWQVPGTPDGTTRVIDRAHPEQSALLYRMRTRRPSSQMPPLGTVVADADAVTRVSKWLQTMR